jgi:hypothetical protein
MTKNFHNIVYLILAFFTFSNCEIKDAEEIESRIFSVDSDDGKKNWTVIGKKWVWSDLDYALEIETIKDSPLFDQMKNEIDKENPKQDSKKIEALLKKKDPVLLANIYLYFMGKTLSSKKGSLILKRPDWIFLDSKSSIVCRSKSLSCSKIKSGAEPSILTTESSTQHLKSFSDIYDVYNLIEFCKDLKDSDDPYYEFYSKKVEDYISKTKWQSIHEYCDNILNTQKKLRKRVQTP